MAGRWAGRPAGRDGDEQRPPAQVTRARTAVAGVFFLGGLVIATWLSRIPHVRDELALTPGQLGRVLLALALGSMIAMPTAGLVIARVGAGRAVAGGMVLGGLSMALAGLGGGPLASVPVVVAALLVLGYGFGTWDVAMNVAGAAVEQQLGRAIMPRLHAGFSLGTMVGAGTGALAAAVHLPVAAHLAAVGTLVVAIGVPATRWFTTAQPADQPPHQPAARSAHPPADLSPSAVAAALPAAATGGRISAWTAWREPRTLLVGLFVLTFALSEGIAYDWLAVAMVDGFGVTNAVGAVGLAVFVTAMTVARTVGSAAIDRFGRVPVLRTSAALAVAGVLLVVFGTTVPVALAGALVWGLGTALGFPVGMSAGADDPARAPVRVSVIASIAYTAFLGGPPLLGWLGDHVGVHQALLVAVAAMVVGAAVAGANRPLAQPTGLAATGRPANRGADGSVTRFG